MDILASMFAYLVCVTGIVIGLVMSFVAVFAAPNQQAPMPQHAVAMAAKPSPVNTTAASAATTIAAIDQTSKHAVSVAVKAETIPPTTIAIDARQKPLFSPKAMRRLAERERSRHLAYRERSSFETRFLGYDD